MYYTVKLKHHIINGNYSKKVFSFDDFDEAVKFAKKEELDIPGSVVAIRQRTEE